MPPLRELARLLSTGQELPDWRSIGSGQLGVVVADALGLFPYAASAFSTLVSL